MTDLSEPTGTLIDLAGSLLGELLQTFTFAPTVAPTIGVDFAKPWLVFADHSVDLQPTAYCTAMWNGDRCSGIHHEYFDSFYHTSGEVEGVPGRRSMWRDGYGGIDMTEKPEKPYIEPLDVDPSWGPVERLNVEGPWSPFAPDGTVRDLEGWTVIGTVVE